jgi:hypothetical protein
VMLAPAMHPSFELPLHQASALQRLLNPGVAQPNLVLFE